jgi:hypothetical protein
LIMPLRIKRWLNSKPLRERGRVIRKQRHRAFTTLTQTCG